MSHRLIDAREVPVITTLGTLDRARLAASAIPAGPPRRVVAVAVGAVIGSGAVLLAVGYAVGSAAGQ